MTTAELERALAALPEPAPPPELAAAVMARLARIDDEPSRTATPERAAGLAWLPVVPGFGLVLAGYLYGLVEDRWGLEIAASPLGAALAGLPVDPVVLATATGTLLCLVALLAREGDRALR